MIDDFLIDTMHTIYQGVTRRYITFLHGGKVANDKGEKKDRKNPYFATQATVS